MQALLPALLLDALHAAPNDKIEALAGVDCNERAVFVTRICVPGVVHAVVVVNSVPISGIPSDLVGHDLRLARDMRRNDGLKLGDGGRVRTEKTSRTTALDRGSSRPRPYPL